MIRHVVDWCDDAGLAWEGGFEWRDEWIVTSGRFSVLLVYTEYTEYVCTGCICPGGGQWTGWWQTV